MSGPPSRLTSVMRFSPEAGRNATVQYFQNFRPTDVGSLSLWLDASDTSTITLTGPGNDEVLIWADKVKGLAFANRGVGFAPTYSSIGFNSRYPGIIFSSGKNLGVTSPAFNFSSADSTCIFIVAQSSSSPSSTSLLFRAGIPPIMPGPPTPLDIGSDPTSTYTFFGSFDITGSANTNTGDITLPFVVAFNVPPAGDSGPKEELSINSATIIQSANNRNGAYSLNAQPAGIFLGFSGAPSPMDSPWDGPIAEILVFNTKLSTANIQKVAGYLGQKWGFQSSLAPPYDVESIYKPPRIGPLFTLVNAQI